MTAKKIDISLEGLLSFNPDDLLNLMPHPASPEDAIQAIYKIAYSIAGDCLFSGVDVQYLQALQEKVKKLGLLFFDSEAVSRRLKTNDWAQNQGYSVLKVIRGTDCNYNCRFCLESAGNITGVDFVSRNKRISYSMDQLARAMAFSRAALNISRVNFSGGNL